MAAEKLDLKTPKTPPPVQAASPEEALNAVKQAVTEARTAYLAALAPLTPAERNELQRELYPVLTEQNQGWTHSVGSCERTPFDWTCWRKWTVPPCTLPPALSCP